MANLRVKVRNVDDETLFTHKTIRIGNKEFDTPRKAISISKARRKDQIASEARGFNEHYFQVDEDLLESAQSTHNANLQKNIGKSLNKGSSEELNVVFINYQSVNQISKKNLNYLCDLIYSTSDILTIPLMPELLTKIKEDGLGTASPHFDSYMNNVTNFIHTYRQINGKPIMGVIPSMPRVFITKIIDFYLNEGIQAYCFNFAGRTVTAQQQLTDMVTPLMRRIAIEEMEEDTMFYTLNAHRGRSKDGGSYIPARDFLSFGFGMDVLGDKHTGGNLPPHLYDKLGDSDPTFRLFQKNDYIYQNYPYDDSLKAKIPDDTELDKSRILKRKNDNYRLATLLNGEQQALETNKLRPAIDEYRIVEHVDGKRGLEPDDFESMKTARESFSNNQDQSTLSSLDDRIG